MALARLKAILDLASWRQSLTAVQECWFDLRYGLDTVVRVPVESLDDMPQEASRHAVQYEPTPLRKFDRALGLLDLDPGRYHFVDFGSGKGRVLLLAARHPFREVVGVEVSRTLHDVAVANVAAFRSGRADCPPIRCVCSDARDFEPPAGDLLAFFYNPFDAEVLAPVLDRVVAATMGAGASLAIIYINPLHHRMIEDRTGLRCVARDPALAVYQS